MILTRASSLLLALVAPSGRIAGQPPLARTSTTPQRIRISPHTLVGTVGGARPELSARPVLSRTAPASLVFTTEDPQPTVELYNDGTINQYTTTLTSMKRRYKLSTRDVRLLRSATRAIQPREGYLLFDLGELKGVLQRDRVTLIGADRPAVTALANEVKQRLVMDRDDREAMLEGRETPFEVRVVECMLEQAPIQAFNAKHA